MKQTVVVTSIAQPTDDVRAIAAMPDRGMVVAGDRATPEPWHCDGVDYLSLEAQRERWPALAAQVSEGVYNRKMFGYLAAIEDGARIIIDTDDDNAPLGEWRFPEFSGDFEALGGDAGFVNIYQLFSDQPIWPRGLPLDLIKRDFELSKRLESAADCNVGVWQALADGDPDVDAIYRLSDGALCDFKARDPVVLAPGVISPYNSQNTATDGAVFELLYLPVTVSFRFTDILRSFVAQPILWRNQLRLGFLGATMRQVRNPHDLVADLAQEIEMYRHSARVVEWVEGKLRGDGIGADLHRAYEELERRDVVGGEEMKALEAWLESLQTATSAADRA